MQVRMKHILVKDEINFTNKRFAIEAGIIIIGVIT